LRKGELPDSSLEKVSNALPVTRKMLPRGNKNFREAAANLRLAAVITAYDAVSNQGVNNATGLVTRAAVNPACHSHFASFRLRPLIGRH
jgi:hypothetical protein